MSELRNLVRAAAVAAIAVLLLGTGSLAVSVSFVRSPDRGAVRTLDPRGDSAFTLKTNTGTRVVDHAIGIAAAAACADPPGRLACLTIPQTSSPTWVNLTGSIGTAPPARTLPAMAYDPDLAATILFGGEVKWGRAASDTWQFRAGHWSNLTPTLASSPPARWGASMVWDGFDGYFLLFGGTNGTPLGDSWTFSGNRWSPAPAGAAPSPRSLSQMVFDQADDLVLLTGGWSGVHTLGETWTYRGGAWSNVTATTPGSPPARSEGSVVFDTSNRSVLLFGGHPDVQNSCSAADSPFRYTRAAGWSALKVDTNFPGPYLNLSEAGAVYDADAPFVLVYGGLVYRGTYCQETIQTLSEYNGSWGTPNAFHSPPADYGFGFVYEPTERGALLFGGVSGSTIYGETWVYRMPEISVALVASSAEVEANVSYGFSAAVEADRGAGALNETWQWGDGTPPSFGVAVAHIYKQPRAVDVTLTSRAADGATDFASDNLSVAPALVGHLLASPQWGVAPWVVSLTANLSGGFAPYTVEWAVVSLTGVAGFGAAGSSTSIDLDRPGVYEVEASALDGARGALELTGPVLLVLAPAAANPTAAWVDYLTVGAVIVGSVAVVVTVLIIRGGVARRER